MRSWLSEIVLALRWLRRRPGLAATAITSLALGIGANAPVFSLVDTLLLRPLPVLRPEELVRVLREKEGVRSDVSAPDFRDLVGMQDVFGRLIASAPFTFSVRAGDATERVQGELVSPDYFEVLGAPLSRGRGFLAPEGSAPVPVVVISDRLFRARFDAAPDVLGRLIRVNGLDLTIVGVAAPGFHGFAIAPESELWAPLPMLPTLWPSVVDFFERRDQPGPAVLGRLRPGVGLEAARQAIASCARALAEAHPDTHGKGTTLRLVPFEETRLSDRGPVVSYLAIVAGVTGIAFFIACVNVAGLKFSDLAGRQGEVAIRRALGASPARLARQLLTENLVLYLPSFVLSWWVAVVGIQLLRRLRLFRIALGEIDLRLDSRALVAALAVTLLGAVLGSLVLVFACRRVGLAGRSGLLAERGRLRFGLVVVQVALSSLLLVGAGLVGRTLLDVYSIDPGFRTADVLFASVDLQSLELRYDETRARGFYRDVLARVEALSGVRSAAWSADTPFERFTILTLFVPEGAIPAGREPDWIQSDADIVSPGFSGRWGSRSCADGTSPITTTRARPASWS
jgi:putative ABC transport system permease protein